MAKKFNLEKFSATNKIKEEKQMENLQLGTGLLNTHSSNLESNDKIDILYLHLDEIVPNPKNDLSMNGIEELAELIFRGRIEQPLVVRQDTDGKYILLTGHRRRAAIELLFEQGKWDKEKLIPCILKDIDKEIDLPLSLDLKEDFSMLQTNRHREMTDSDLYSESRRWKKIFDEVRKQGIEMLPIGILTDGTVEYQQIKGEKSRNLIAKQIGCSPALVGQHEAIDKKGSEELKEAMLNDEISVYLASEIVGQLNEEEQQEFVKEVIENKENGEKTSKSDLLKFKEKKERKQKGIKAEKKTITLEIFKDDTKNVSDLLKMNTVQLDERKYERYLKAIHSLEKILLQ
ncbi:ParB/RepB/Spo0J family partition protein [Faecalimonas sp.]